MRWEEACEKTGADMIGGQVILRHNGVHLLVGNLVDGLFHLTDAGEAHLRELLPDFVKTAPEGPGKADPVVAADAPQESAVAPVNSVTDEPAPKAKRAAKVEVAADEQIDIDELLG